MPEESKGFFDDLPDKADAKDENGSPPDRAEEPKTDAQARNDSEKERNLAKAIKSEVERMEKLKELRKVREERKRLQREVDSPEETNQPKEEPKPAVPDVGDEVRKALEAERMKAYDAEAVAEIKSFAKGSSLTREEAEAVYAEYQRLPKCGNAKLDAKFALDRYVAVRNMRERAPSMPTFSASSPFDAGNDAPDITETQRRVNAEVGISDADFRKYKGGFNEVAKSVFKGGYLDRSGESN